MTYIWKEGQKIMVDGKPAVVTRIKLPGPYGDNSIEYRTPDGALVKDNPALTAYYGKRKYDIVPNTLFQAWRPDEVAECLSGVPVEVYQKLWDLVPLYEKQSRENIEDRGPEVDYTLSEYWEHLDLEQKATLNELAEAQHKRDWGDDNENTE